VPRHGYRTGPKLDPTALSRLAGLETGHEESPTWRGWCLGILSCAFLAAIIPYVDFIIRCTRVTLNVLPAPPMVLLLALIATFNLLLGRWMAWLRLTRQDLVLIFCMTMVMNAIPGVGFLNYLINGQMGLTYYASPENNWREVLHPHIPEALAARDPADPNAPGPRPVEWFYSGLPRTEAPGQTLKTVFGILLPPYLRWCVVIVCLFGMFFALSGILYRQWGDRERLPFPLAQVPQTMLQGLFGDEVEAPFVRDRLAWLGIGLTFALHSWNALGDYVGNWAPIPMKNYLQGYFTEGVWKYLEPTWCHIFPSVIAFMYLVSLEVSFSLWFFYLVVFKLGVVIASGVFGIGENGWFFDIATNGPRGIFTNQGAAALLVMVVASLVMARRVLWASLREALGLSAPAPQEAFSPRVLWSTLLLSIAGTVAWLAWFGMDWYWALPLVILLLLAATGAARLVSEGGVLFPRAPLPSDLLMVAVTPVDLGARNYTLVSLCGKTFDFDWFRMTPMTNILGAFHLGALTRTRLRPLLAGLIAALVLAYGIGFFSYHYVCYTNPGGARYLGWCFGWSAGFYGDMASKVKTIQSYEKRKAQSAAQGQPLPEAERPDIARTDWWKVSWMGVGGSMMALFLFLRTRVFWWPHPIGYVMWNMLQPVRTMWFSFFIGWLLKTLILKFGGLRAFHRSRRFFVGLVVGEALATIFWIIVAWLMGFSGGYSIEYN